MKEISNLMIINILCLSMNLSLIISDAILFSKVCSIFNKINYKMKIYFFIHLIFSILIFTIFYCLNKNISDLILLILLSISFFYYIFRDLIEQLIIGLLLGIVLIYNGIYEFFTGKHVDLLTFAVMPTTSMIIKNFCFL